MGMKRTNTNNALITSDGDYDGKYVTTCGANSTTVVSSSTSPVEAVREAKSKGCEDPVLIYVPTKDEHTFIL